MHSWKGKKTGRYRFYLQFGARLTDAPLLNENGRNDQTKVQNFALDLKQMDRGVEFWYMIPLIPVGLFWVYAAICSLLLWAFDVNIPYDHNKIANFVGNDLLEYTLGPTQFNLFVPIWNIALMLFWVTILFYSYFIFPVLLLFGVLKILSLPFKKSFIE